MADTRVLISGTLVNMTLKFNTQRWRTILFESFFLSVGHNPRLNPFRPKNCPGPLPSYVSFGVCYECLIGQGIEIDASDINSCMPTRSASSGCAAAHPDGEFQLNAVLNRELKQLKSGFRKACQNLLLTQLTNSNVLEGFFRIEQCHAIPGHDHDITS